MAGQAAYDLPAALNEASGERILELTVDGKEYERGSASQARKLAQGELFLRGYGFFWIDFSATGEEQLNLYPTPQASGLAIAGRCVVEPAELVEATDAPKVPGRFRSVIADYAIGKALGMLENNPELRVFYEEQFGRKVAELNALRNSRAGRGPAQVQIEGVHF